MAKKATTRAPARTAAGKTVDGYIAGLDGWRAAAVKSIRRIILRAAPRASESIKWAQPVYEQDGPFCYVRAFKDSVNFGFWRGAEMKDPDKLLQGSGDKMRHVKLTSLKDVRPPAFAALVRQAVRLNKLKGDPTRG